jgi:hypothetical protein
MPSKNEAKKDIKMIIDALFDRREMKVRKAWPQGEKPSKPSGNRRQEQKAFGFE